jgi:hypothetical protein
MKQREELAAVVDITNLKEYAIRAYSFGKFATP